MNQQNKQIKNFDQPIPKPSDDYLEKFLRSTEARFITKRLNTRDSQTLKSRGNVKRPRPQ